MKFTKELIEELNVWLLANGFDLECSIGEELQYDAMIDTIIVPFEYDNSLDTYFMKFLRKNGLENNFDAITLSLLHEIGHSQTHHLFTTNEWNSDAVLKTMLVMTDASIEEINYGYWSTATELSANLWLIMYVKLFAKKVDELERIIESHYEE